MNPVRLELVNKMKQACESRMQRQQEQFLDYLNAAFVDENVPQPQSFMNSNGFDDEQDNDPHDENPGMALIPASEYDGGLADENSIHHDPLEASGNSGNEAQSQDLSEPRLEHALLISSDEDTVDRVPQWEIEYDNAPLDLETSPAQCSDLYGELEAPAGEQSQPQEPTLLERLGESVPEPKPWQVVLHQQKIPSSLKMDSKFEQVNIWGKIEQHGLFQELYKKYEKEKGKSSSTPTFEERTAAPGGQDVPTRAKTLLEIYYEAKAEAHSR